MAFRTADKRRYFDGLAGYQEKTAERLIGKALSKKQLVFCYLRRI
ncbi:hypothetical protein CLOSTMETH_01927 [[Clostridium] methylpentosum DSM 5476]|uniref:Uncharacterized protein n=1 Tax=[Clostridium] methylpentosum DSM 5476 TaxID=537013 RepID=C0EDK0_9FIRM|nr:hypothetical protein CLOSTMETH_01927 [[Clostridium] methylpentosum DSM 5476]